jgi:hypothetical protein
MKYMPIPQDVAEQARVTLRDPFGHQLRVERNQGPCRLCLGSSKEPEDLILLSYQPLDDTNPYAEIGPIFIHPYACAPYSAPTFPPDFLDRELVVRAYDANGRIADATVAAPGEADAATAAFLANDDIAEVHVRSRAYTCFLFKVVRT